MKNKLKIHLNANTKVLQKNKPIQKRKKIKIKINIKIKKIINILPQQCDYWQRNSGIRTYHNK